MYYSEDLVEEIRVRNDIVEVVSSYVKLQRKGSSHFGLCPFHNEKSPSFSVTPSKQMYYCFGCGAGGNVFTFLMEYENFNFQEALQFLAKRGGVELPEKEAFSPEAKRQSDLKSTLLEIQKEAAKYFYYQLKTEKGSKALEYLLERGMTEETIKKFGLGYSNKTSNDLYLYLKQNGYSDSLLKESGLVSIEERGNYDKFWNRVMFPIMDVHNKVIGFGGRVMGEGSPKYLNSPETKIFDKSRNLYGMNIARSSRRPYIIICEGYTDVIGLHQSGFTNAVASLGTAFTVQQANLLKRYTPEVMLAYDSDGAGVKAILRALPIMKEAGLTTKVINLKPYKDPDDFIKNLGEEEFEKRITDASNSFLFEIEILNRDYNMEDPQEKTDFHKEIARRLLQFPIELERNNYIEAISAKYFINYDNLVSLVNSYGYSIGGQTVEKKSKNIASNSGKFKKSEKADGNLYSQKLLLTWLIEDISLFEKIKGVISPRDFTQELYHTVAELLFAQYEAEKNVNPAKIISHFSTEEEHKEVATLFNTSLQEELTASDRERAINDTIKKVKIHWCEYASNHVTDLAELMEISQIKRSIQDLHISFN
ncbi:MAG: DNA primase [Clostridiales bacterium]|nr:DNA primase [Clostridiales bacterium]